MRISRFFVALAMVFACVQAARAGLLIDAGPSSTVENFLGGNYVAGTEFTSTTSFLINSLGYLDAQGDGLEGNHLVGLWNAGNQALLASVTVTPTSQTVLSAQGTGVWYLGNITPLLIGPGTYRVAGITGSERDADSLSNDKIGNGVTLSSGYVRTDFPNGGFAFPNLTFGSQAIRATVGVGPLQPVPEPSTFAPAVLGVLGLAGYGRRRAMKPVA